MEFSRVISNFKDRDFLINKNRIFTYNDLFLALTKSKEFLQKNKIFSGDVVSIEGDFSINSIALFFALIELKVIIVPMLRSLPKKTKDDFAEIAKVKIKIMIDENDQISIARTAKNSSTLLVNKFRKENKSGLILFSSGSTGANKAILHDLGKMLNLYKPTISKVSIAFLLFDHIGGINTLFHNLINGGCLIALKDRQTKTVCEAIEKYKVQILPVSPTFINLFLLSEDYKNYDLSSLDVVKYGSEVMSEEILKKFRNLFPKIKLKQTYGLSEIGVLNVKSQDSDSLFIKLEDNNFLIRIVDNAIEIKNDFSMVGYINSDENPFTEDGWFRTGDLVVQDGDLIKILGRKSEIINVGGLKVYPSEVENILRKVENILDVVVKGEFNAITGQIVTATVVLKKDEDIATLTKRIRINLKNQLENYKIPQKIKVVTNDELYNVRFKKIRK